MNFPILMHWCNQIERARLRRLAVAVRIAEAVNAAGDACEAAGGTPAEVLDARQAARIAATAGTAAALADEERSTPPLRAGRGGRKSAAGVPRGGRVRAPPEFLAKSGVPEIQRTGTGVGGEGEAGAKGAGVSKGGQR